MFEQDDEEIYQGIYENGHWIWDGQSETLKFVSDNTSSEEELIDISKTAIQAVEFKDDVDLWEQQKFRKRLQRKTKDGDVVTIQDVRDVVLFTAPRKILSPAVINLLHLPATERFLRALILYCQYYLQISDVMNHRLLELETKIRTKTSDEIESKYREDLDDLRVIVAIEYCFITSGDGEFCKYHHMGKLKKLSLSKKDAILFETILRIGIQIVWIALGRKHFNLIESELNRIFKSDIYNSAEHRLGVKLTKLNPFERNVLLGQCVRPKKKINTNSPLVNDVFCQRFIDYRLFGLGVVKYKGLDARLQYIESILSKPEYKFRQLDVSLGIIGLQRSGFDIMLKEIKAATSSGSTSSAGIRRSTSRSSRASRIVSRRSVASGTPLKLYPDIYLPNKSSTPELLPEHFPLETLPSFTKNEAQRLKWISYASKKRKIATKTFFK